MARWDMLVVIAAVAGGAMLIESSHRVDTGASDDDVVATAPADCTAVYAATRISPADDNAPREEAAMAVPSECTNR